MTTTPIRLRDQRGTAVTETLLLTWILVMFAASAFQLFRVNQAIYSSITTAHKLMFDGAWTANCFNRTSRCVFNSDDHAQVIWRAGNGPRDMPEVLVARVGLFRQLLAGDLRLTAWRNAATPRPGRFKRTRMGAGTYYPICRCSGFSSDQCLVSLKTPSYGGCV
jgi:hypothetical protein